MPASGDSKPYQVGRKYHVVFIPKYRRKALYHELRRHLGEVFRALAEQKECRIEEGHLMGDHVHAPRRFPRSTPWPRSWASSRGKRPSTLTDLHGTPQELTGHHFWARGYYVSTVGRDEAAIREYIRTQEAEDRRLDQMDLW